MLSRELERTLHRALSYASERRHAYATLEHLLLGLADDTDAAAVLRACSVDLDRLRADLTDFLDKDLAGLATERPGDPKPTAGFQRVVQRAAIHLQSAGRDEVTGANVLQALFSERESHAVFFLQSHDMTRLDATNFISHGIAKARGRSGTGPARQPARPGGSLLGTIDRALAAARERRHSHATLEHLLLALTDDADAASVLRACGVDLDRLRGDLAAFLDKELTGLVVDGSEDPQETAGFLRVVQRAAMHVQSSGRDQVIGANILIALFSERESHAVYFLQSQDMTRLDAVNFLSHGIAKAPGRVGGGPPQAAQGNATRQRPDAGQLGEADRAGTFKVLLFKDDATPMEFVIDVLRRVFGKSSDDAFALLVDVHRTGSGVCGVFGRELAEAKVGWAMDLARLTGHPLRCTIEKA